MNRSNCYLLYVQIIKSEFVVGLKSNHMDYLYRFPFLNHYFVVNLTINTSLNQTFEALEPKVLIKGVIFTFRVSLN